jgi:hypothetical protein
MANPTTNFGWQMPTSTDLVTDLPADFEVFGQAVDTALVDLKGGTTGQVLSKASNTDMDFTWVAQDDSNAIQNAIVDAKGDLIAASANDTPARLAVGTNGQVLKANSAAATGLEWGSATPTGVGCSLYRATDQAVSNATETGISWNTELYDTNSFHDNSTNPTRMTIPTGYGGKYLLTASIAYDNNAVGQRVAYIHVNNTLAFLSAIANVSATIDAYNTFSYAMNLSAGDYVETRVYQDSGGSLNILGGVQYYANVQLSYLGA